MSLFSKAKTKLGSMFGNKADKPDIIHSDGTREWFVASKRHKEGDGPAVIYFKDGQEFTGEQWAERQKLKTQSLVDVSVAMIHQGLPENMTIGRPLRYRTGFAATTA